MYIIGWTPNFKYVRNKLIFLIGLHKKFEIVLKCVKNDVIYILWVVIFYVLIWLLAFL